MFGTVADLSWGLLALGLCAGVISGMLGLGSGTLLIPGLVLVFGFPQKSAQGTALAVMVPMVLIGAVRYRLHPEIDVRVAPIALMAGGAVAGALLGTAPGARLPAHALRRIFAVFLLIVAVRMLVPRRQPRGPTAGEHSPQAAVLTPLAQGAPFDEDGE